MTEAKTIALLLLRAIAKRGKNARFQLRVGKLYCNDSVVASSEEPLSENGYVARVERLARNLGLPAVSVTKLASCWEQALRAGRPIDADELIEVAKSQACVATHEISGPIAKWRQSFETRLRAARLGFETVERFGGPASPSRRQHTLELEPVAQLWPNLLLTDPAWAYAEAPFKAIKPMPLDHVWVDLHFVDSDQVEELALESDLRELEERRYKERLGVAVSPDFLVDGLNGLVALVGAPGIGKTTLVKWLARRLIMHPEGRFLLPLVVPLRSYARARRSKGMIAFALRNCGVLSEKQVQLWEDAVGRLAGPSRNNVLLLLDGWDEVPAEQRDGLRHEIETLSHGFTIVITSRPSAYPRKTLPADKFFEITELSPESITALAFRWFESAGQPLQANSLLEHLEAHPALQGLARNPFLLTVLCGIAYNPDGTFNVNLPTTRTEIYGRTIERIQAGHPDNLFTDEQLRQTERLALWLLTDAPGAPRYVFDQDDVRKCSGSARLLTRVLKPSRLLSQWDYDKETLHFIHTTFHEYLAAAGLSHSEDAALASKLLTEHLFDTAWHEVFRFLAGGSHKSKPIFWDTLSEAAKEPDRFGLFFTRLAHFVREAGAADGGQSLLGCDLREVFWSYLQKNIEPEAFADACLQLDADWFTKRVESVLTKRGKGPADELTTILLRTAKRARTRKSSKLLLEEILSGSEEHGGIASYVDSRGLRVEDVAILRRKIHDDSLPPPIRRRVLRTLGSVQDHQSVPLLAELVKQKDPLGHDALFALSTIGGRRALDAMQNLLRQATDDGWRLEVVAALGRTHEARARDILLDELARVDNLDDPFATTILDALIDAPIGRHSAIIIDFLQKSSHDATRTNAAWVLSGGNGADVSEALAKAAQEDQTEEVRLAALGALRGQVRSIDTAWLEERAKDNNSSLADRTKALEALLAYVSRRRSEHMELQSRVEKIVFDALNLPRTDLALEAATRSYLVGPIVAPRLRQICTDANAWDAVREAACTSLQKLRDEAAVDVLLQLIRQEPDVPNDEAAVLGNVSQRVARAAAEALSVINPHSLLGESSRTAARALAAYCVRNGCLAFADHIRDARGRKLFRTGTEFASDEPSSFSPKPNDISRKAWTAQCAYDLAERHLGKKAKDRQAYDWLREHGPPDLELPKFESWERYLREARKHSRTQKHLPRRGRKGGSIVRPEDIERRRDAD